MQERTTRSCVAFTSAFTDPHLKPRPCSTGACNHNKKITFVAAAAAAAAAAARTSPSLMCAHMAAKIRVMVCRRLLVPQRPHNTTAPASTQVLVHNAFSRHRQTGCITSTLHDGHFSRENMRSSHVPAHATRLIRKIGAIIRGGMCVKLWGGRGQEMRSWEATA